MSEDYKIQQVISMLGCTEDQAKQYLIASDGDVLAAIDANLVVPVISGTKHMPPPRVVDDGLTDETRQKLNEARTFSTLLNASHRNDLHGSSTTHEQWEQSPEQGQAQEQQQVQLAVPVVGVSLDHS